MAVLILSTAGEDKESKFRDSVNLLLSDAVEQTDNLKDIIQEAPYILGGYENFKTILRSVKRGNSFSSAIDENCDVSCPPKVYPTDECDNIKCSSCWREFCLNYLEAISKNNKGAGEH